MEQLSNRTQDLGISLSLKWNKCASSMSDSVRSIASTFGSATASSLPSGDELSRVRSTSSSVVVGDGAVVDDGTVVLVRLRCLR